MVELNSRIATVDPHDSAQKTQFVALEKRARSLEREVVALYERAFLGKIAKLYCDRPSLNFDGRGKEHRPARSPVPDHAALVHSLMTSASMVKASFRSA
jgi:hypothetical protein